MKSTITLSITAVILILNSCATQPSASPSGNKTTNLAMKAMSLCPMHFVLKKIIPSATAKKQRDPKAQSPSPIDNQ